MIRDNKLYQLPNLMQRGRAFGMIRLDDSLAEHVRTGNLTEEVALRATENKRELAAMLRPQERPTPNPAAGPGQSQPAAAPAKKGGFFSRKD
jgi:Tfp pilus assembly ATPase PilU